MEMIQVYFKMHFDFTGFIPFRICVLLLFRHLPFNMDRHSQKDRAPVQSSNSGCEKFQLAESVMWLKADTLLPSTHY